MDSKCVVIVCVTLVAVSVHAGLFNNIRCQSYLGSLIASSTTDDDNSCQITCRRYNGGTLKVFNRPNFESCGWFKACVNGTCIKILDGPTLVGSTSADTSSTTASSSDSSASSSSASSDATTAAASDASTDATTAAAS